MTGKYVTAARQLDEITVTEPVFGQLLSGFETEVEPGTYQVLREISLQPTDGDLVCIDIEPDSEDGESWFWGRAAFVSVRDDGTPRTKTLDFMGVFERMAAERGA